MQKQAKAIANRDDRGVKQAGFLVLRETAMPAVLIETGYLTNADEEAFIASDEGHYQMAEAIFTAFKNYKAQMEGEPVAQTKTQRAKGTASTKNIEKKQPTAPAPRKTADSGTTAAIQSGENAFGKSGSAPKTEKKYEKSENKTEAKNTEGKTNPGANSKLVNQKTVENQPNTDKKSSYRILLLTHNAPMDRNSGLLALLENVKEEKQNGKYQYFTGNFATRSDAEKMLPELKNLGFATAVITGNPK
jgi:hypothetical protein